MDLHIHSMYSRDSTMTPQLISKIAIRRKLSGFAITDHNAIRGARKALEFKQKDILFVPGIEVTSDKGHILGLGITELIPKGLSVQDTIDKINEAGGLPIAAHPYRFYTGLGENAVRQAKFKVIEILNSRTTMRGNIKARTLAKELEAGVTGGSDGHKTDEIGRAFTKVPENVATVDDLIEAIMKRRTRVGGMSAGLGEITSNSASNAVNWLGRGMSKM
jgi:predicted metal-dependent phosphoesterase TrpH